MRRHPGGQDTVNRFAMRLTDIRLCTVAGGRRNSGRASGKDRVNAGRLQAKAGWRAAARYLWSLLRTDAAPLPLNEFAAKDLSGG